MADPRDQTGNHLRNALGLRRFENKLAKDADRDLDKVADATIGDVVRNDPAAVSAGRRMRRVRGILARAAERLKVAMRRIRQRSTGELIELGTVQSEFAAERLRRAIGEGAPVVATLDTQAARDVVVHLNMRGQRYVEWYNRERVVTGHRLETALRIAADEVHDLRDVRRTVGGIYTQTKRGTRSILGTAVNHVTANTHRLTYEGAAEITEEYVYTAILDDRTTDICMSLDGRIFSFADPEARFPPQHHRCRSIIVPVIKFPDLGITPPAEGVKPAQGGSVSSSTRYADWLRQQPHFVQDEILGPARANMFRSGRLKMTDLVRRDGRTVTLTELRRVIDV